MRNMLLGVVASGRRSSEPKEVTFTVVVGEGTSINTTWRGGGQVSGLAGPIQLGSLSPSGFSLRGYVIQGIAAGRLVVKEQTSHSFAVYVEGGARPTANLVAQVQGLASPLVLVANQSPDLSTGWWGCHSTLPDAALYNNWAPGVTRTVTLRWES